MSSHGCQWCANQKHFTIYWWKTAYCKLHKVRSFRKHIFGKQPQNIAFSVTCLGWLLEDWVHQSISNDLAYIELLVKFSKPKKFNYIRAERFPYLSGNRHHRPKLEKKVIWKIPILALPPNISLITKPNRRCAYWPILAVVALKAYFTELYHREWH